MDELPWERRALDIMYLSFRDLIVLNTNIPKKCISAKPLKYGPTNCTAELVFNKILPLASGN